MDTPTLRMVLVVALFAGVFIVVPVIYTLAKLQMRMAALAAQRDSAANSNLLEQRLAALEQEVAVLRSQHSLNGKSDIPLPSDLHLQG